MPRHQLALCVQTCAEAADARGTVEVVLHVFAAAPQCLHWCALHGLCHDCGLGNDVHLEATAKAAAQHGDVQLHFGHVDTELLGHHFASQIGYLGRRPHLRLAVFEPHGTSHGFHGGMGQIRCVVFGFHCACRFLQSVFGVAIGEISKARVAVQGFAQLCSYGVAGPRRRRRVVPLHFHLRERFHGLVGGCGDHRHSRAGAMQGVDRQHFFHARHCQRFAVVKALQLAAQHGVHAHTGKQQATGTNVTDEHGRAVAFGLNVQARQTLPNQLEIHRRLEGDGRR